MNGMRKGVFWEWFNNSHFMKILLIGFLVLLLQIPIYQIRGVIEEREQTREEAVQEVTAKWGRSQSLIGPSIIVPYINRSYQSSNSRQRQFEPNIEYATFLPEELKISGRLDSQLLYRGIYEIPVYKTFNFSFSLELNGSVGAFFVPFGRDTEVQIDSDWNSPSFQGTWLPKNRTVNSDGFKATWSVPFLSRNYAQKWLTSPGMEQDITESKFGVEMISPVDHYRMSQRSVKYQILFLVLTFTTLWLFEVLTKIRVHPVQYLLIGVGMCLFYLLELSLAEHFGFIRSYMIASAAIIILVTSYSAAVLKTSKRAIIVGLVVTLLYIYLYVLLMIEDYALLAGSIGLFITLAAIMFLTRKVDWYSLTDVIVTKTQLEDKQQ